MIHQPFQCNKDIKAWAGLLKNLRVFFDSRGFFEVSTPQLVACGAFESSIDPLQVSFSSGLGELHTSPEIQMKALIAEADLPIYQICKCFRDDPATDIHAIEFTMLEYYRTGGSYQDIQNDMTELLQSLSPQKLNFRSYSLLDYLAELTKIDLTRHTTKEALAESIRSKNTISLSPGDGWEDMFFKLLIEKVEPSLDPAIPTLFKDYPASVSPLSNVNLTTGLAERFEIYWHGMELCNGCVELIDPRKLKENYDRESTARMNQGKHPHPVPHSLYESAKRLKNCAGVAVGLERLFLCLQH